MITLDKEVLNISYATVGHKRSILKPNEDYIYCNNQNKLYMLLDGITRVHKEYDEKPNCSAACDVNEIFSSAVISYIDEYIDCEDNVEKLLRKSVALGNQKIAEYRSYKTKEEWGFYPGTLGIIALIKNHRLHYICTGDCIGVIIRGNSKICFGEQMTVEAVDVIKATKNERYDLYCNHPGNEFSYLIFNGDDCVSDNCEYSFINLEDDDVIIFASDGIKKCIKYSDVESLRTLTAEELILKSIKYDSLPFNEYGDDKSIIKIRI